MKIALIRCPWVTVSSYPPEIGLCYITTILKKNGHEVLVIDLNIEFYRKIEEAERNNIDCCNPTVLSEFSKVSLQKYDFILEDTIKRISGFMPEVVGFSVWETNKVISLEIARRLKKINPSIFTVFGGPECYPLFSGTELAGDPCVDLVIYGEAEITLPKILNSLEAGKRFTHVTGSIFKRDGRIIDGGPGETVRDLDTLPVLDLDDFPLNSYGQRSLPVSFNRGCVYRCEYCPREMYPNFRYRSAENVVAEIEYLTGRHSINNFLVCDATVTSNLSQINRISELIISRGMKLSMGGFASPHPGLNEKVLSKLRKAGFCFFVYGVESGSERILNRIGKKIRLQVIEKVIRDSYEAGIDVGVDILVGLPGEREEDFAKTTDFLVRNRKYITNIGINCFEAIPYSYIFLNTGQFDFVPEEVKFERLSKLKGLVESLKLTETVQRRIIEAETLR